MFPYNWKKYFEIYRYNYMAVFCQNDHYVRMYSFVFRYCLLYHIKCPCTYTMTIIIHTPTQCIGECHLPTISSWMCVLTRFGYCNIATLYKDLHNSEYRFSHTEADIPVLLSNNAVHSILLPGLFIVHQISEGRVTYRQPL